MDDVATAIELSRAVVRNIHMNLFWAFFYNILGIPLAAGALYPFFQLRLSPMIGSAAMSLSSVCVVTNALRLRFFRAKGAQTVEEGPLSGGTSQIETNTNSMAAEEEQSQEPENEKGSCAMKKVLTVDGMMCAHCQMHVKKALEGVDGVTEAVVDLETKKATVTLSKDVADQVLMDAITEAGYTPLDCTAA